VARPLTVSIGVDVLDPQQGERELDDLLLGADRALYRAKDDGRDRVQVHPARTDRLP
jgi:PleD family two-component response regulator